jgi:VanZ family protein
LWTLLLAGYWLALFAATHVPKRLPVPRVDHWDKLAHFSAFALLALLLSAAWQSGAGQLNWRHLRAAWVVLILYGAFDEWTQPLVGRDASFFDWLADSLGSAVGLAAFAWLAKAMRRQPRI